VSHAAFAEGDEGDLGRREKAVHEDQGENQEEFDD
jgi:hypothetical protein